MKFIVIVILNLLLISNLFSQENPKKYWEGALNCYKYTDNPAKESQRPYVDELVTSVENYKNSNSSSAKNDIFMYSNMIVENLGCSKDLFK